MKKMTKRFLGSTGAAAATGAALAGAYYYYGSEQAAAHRRQLKSWARSAEKEIVQRARQFKDTALSDETIRGVIAEVAKRYEATRDIDRKDIRDFVGTIQKGFKEARKSVMSRHAASSKKKSTKKKTSSKRKKSS